VLAQGGQGLIFAEPTGEAEQDRGRLVCHARPLVFEHAEVATLRGVFRKYWSVSAGSIHQQGSEHPEVIGGDKG
jgi:hypothetical protein